MAAPTNKKDPASSTKKAQAEPQAAAAAAPKKSAAAPAEPKGVKTVNPAGDAQMSTKEPRKDSRGETGAEQIARRAYELWLERGGNHGDDQGDWHRAERELSGGQRHS